MQRKKSQTKAQKQVNVILKQLSLNSL